jgi:hypothetical protein
VPRADRPKFDLTHIVQITLNYKPFDEYRKKSCTAAKMPC